MQPAKSSREWRHWQTGPSVALILWVQLGVFVELGGFTMCLTESLGYSYLSSPSGGLFTRRKEKPKCCTVGIFLQIFSHPTFSNGLVSKACKRSWCVSFSYPYSHLPSPAFRDVLDNKEPKQLVLFCEPISNFCFSRIFDVLCKTLQTYIPFNCEYISKIATYPGAPPERHHYCTGTDLCASEVSGRGKLTI